MKAKRQAIGFSKIPIEQYYPQDGASFNTTDACLNSVIETEESNLTFRSKRKEYEQQQRINA